MIIIGACCLLLLPAAACCCCLPCQAHTGVMPPDSIDLWPAIAGDLPSPRTEVVHQVQNAYFTENVVAIQAGDMKYMHGVSIGDNRILRWPLPGQTAVPYGLTTGLRENATDGCRVGTTVPKGGQNSGCAGLGCLFNVTSDPTETINLLGPLHVTPAYKQLAAKLNARVTAIGAAAPPVSRYFEEACICPVFHGCNCTPGGGYLKTMLDQICAVEAKTGLLEPAQ